MIEPIKVSSDEAYTGQRATEVLFEDEDNYVHTVSIGDKDEVLDTHVEHHSEEDLFALLLHIMTGGEF